LDENASVTSAEFDRASRHVLTVGNNQIRLWDAHNGTSVLKIIVTNTIRAAACFLADTNQMAVASGRSILIYSTVSGKVLREFHRATASSGGFQTLALSPDGRYLAAGAGDQSLHIFNLQTGMPLSAPLWQAGTPVVPEFSPDSQYVITSSPAPSPKVWEVGKPQPFLPVLEHEQREIGAQFSSDGQWIATSSMGGYARLWDFASGELVEKFFHGDMAPVACFNPRTGELLTGGADGRACLWKPQSCEFSLAQIASLAEVLFCQKLDSQGSILPVPAEEADALFHPLQRVLPGAFRTTLAQKVYWHERMADLAYKSNLWTAVVFHLSRAFELNPSLVESPTGDQLLIHHGEALAEQGRFTEAEADFRRATELDPGNMRSWEDWGCTALAQSKTNVYADVCRKAFRQFKHHQFTPAAEGAFGSADMRGAVANLSSHPGLDDYTFLRADIEAFCQEFQRPISPDTVTIRGKLRYRVGALDQAIADFQQGDQGDPETFFFLAMALHRLGKTKEALEKYQRGLSMLEQTEKTAAAWDARVLNRLEQREAQSVLRVAAPNPGPAGASLP